MTAEAEIGYDASISQGFPARVALLTTSAGETSSGKEEELIQRRLPLKVVRFEATDPEQLRALEESFRIPTRRMGTEQKQTAIVALGDPAAELALEFKEGDDTGNVGRLVIVGAEKVGQLSVPEFVASETMVLIPDRSTVNNYDPGRRKLKGAENVVYEVSGQKTRNGVIPRRVRPGEEIEQAFFTGNGNFNLPRIVHHLARVPYTPPPRKG